MAKGKGIQLQGLLGVALVAILFFYVGVKFIGEDVDGNTIFQKPNSDDLSKLPLQVMKFLVIGVGILGAYALITKISGAPMTKKDAFALILVGIGFWLLWDKVLGNYIGEINEVAFTVAKKIGVM